MEGQETFLWKVEPLSPSGTPPLDIDDEWLYLDDEKPAIFEGSGEESGLYEEHYSRAQVASKLLEELELKPWIKEESSFADWFEEKIDLPIFEELPAPECGQNRAVIYPNVLKQQQQQLIQHQQVDATQSLLREFETVLGDVEACHQITNVSNGVISTLTPPQSPPPLSKQQLILSQQQQQHVVQHPNAQLLVSLQPLQHQVNAATAAFVYEQQQQLQQRHENITVIGHQQEPYALSLSSEPVVIQQQQQQQQLNDQWNAENLSLVPLVHVNDVANELAKVDEYVRSCAEDVAASSSSSASSTAASAPPSPCTSSNASCISSEDSADDPDWSYETTASTSTSSGRKATSSGSSGSTRGRRVKPYSRPNVEDKKVRKKEQNKNAATRYRQKKKQEIKEILGEEQELAERNDKLQGQVKDLQREIGYLKNLMRDLFKGKGLIK